MRRRREGITKKREETSSDECAEEKEGQRVYGREKLKGKNRGGRRRGKKGFDMDEGLASVGGRAGNAGEDKKRDAEEEKREQDNANANSEFRVAIYAELSPTFVTHANGTRTTFFPRRP